jgi:hypothetical protein
VSGDVERVAEVLIQHQRIPLFDGTGGQRCVGCDSLRGETDGPNSPRHARHVAQVLVAPGGVVAGMVAEAREAGVEEGVDSTWHLKQLRAMWEAAARKQGAAEVRARVERLADEWERKAANLAPDDDWGDTIGDTIAGDIYRGLARKVRAALADPSEVDA